MDLIIAPKARGDIAGILTWTAENFGPQTLRRYAKLLATALGEVAASPTSKFCSLRTGCRTWSCSPLKTQVMTEGGTMPEDANRTTELHAGADPAGRRGSEGRAWL